VPLPAPYTAEGPVASARALCRALQDEAAITREPFEPCISCRW
jgi:hypothetical protein